METLYRENHALINYHPEKKLMSLHLIHDVNFSDYKKSLHKLLEKIQAKELKALILDQRYAEELTMEEKAWFVSQWFPKLEGLIGAPKNNFKVAIISAKTLMSKMGSEYIVNTLSKTSMLSLTYKESMDEALQWLEN